MASSLEKSKKKLNDVNKPLHPSTNPEILVKIGLLMTEKQVLEIQPLKIYLYIKWRKNIGKIYSPFSKFAKRAKQSPVMWDSTFRDQCWSCCQPSVKQSNKAYHRGIWNKNGSKTPNAGPHHSHNVINPCIGSWVLLWWDRQARMIGVALASAGRLIRPLDMKPSKYLITEFSGARYSFWHQNVSNSKEKHRKVGNSCIIVVKQFLR